MKVAKRYVLFLFTFYTTSILDLGQQKGKQNLEEEEKCEGLFTLKLCLQLDSCLLACEVVRDDGKVEKKESDQEK